MEIEGLIFLITVGLLYAVSIWIVSVKGNNEFMAGHSVSESHPLVRVENWHYIPSILASLLVVGWYVFIKNPYEPISVLTPSIATSGWLLTIGAAYLVFMPFGLAYGSLMLSVRVKPESKWISVVVNILLIVSLALQAVLLFHVYSLWFFWIPMTLTSVLLMVLREIFPMIFYTPRNHNAISSSSIPITHSSSSRRAPSMSSSYPQVRRSSASQSSSSSDSEADESDMLARQAKADEYYYQYQQYQDQAQRLLSEAESYDRSAEDNEYWAREANNSFKASEARNDRNRASRLRNEAQRAQREADRYYGLYQQCRR
ncbi:MAG: hypothetical protein K2H60_01785 [Muribaculaceae bacterium]|nr:hypothetical protein [Muribaculaceae bacterium]